VVGTAADRIFRVHLNHFHAFWGPASVTTSFTRETIREDFHIWKICKPSTVIDAGKLSLRVWRDRFYSSEDDAPFDHREIYFEIDQGNTMLAAGRFVEWRIIDPERACLLSEFVEEADTSSQAAYEMARAVHAGWHKLEDDEGLNPFDFGTLICFDRLRISKGAPSDDIWAAIKEHLIKRRFSRRSAMLVLKGFPLEYEGCLTEDNVGRFNHRQKAMVRLYMRRLGAEPFDGGKDGWLWLPLRSDLCPARSANGGGAMHRENEAR
jgi:hypothetical protein